MQTRKLYYEDAYTQRFRARVQQCRPVRGGWAVALDATAFFPEEGGQTADTGTLGGVAVTGAYEEKDGTIWHLTGAPLTEGEEVEGRLDWAERFRKMQTHTAEHILSGLAHRKYGYDNVGFHLGADGCTVDLSGELDREQLDELEDEVNAAVWADLPVRARFPLWPELKTLDYRSKLDLTENVRIVSVEGIDQCACCAPHVSSTGQIGPVKILDFMRHRGGVRLWMKAGSDALADHRARYGATAEISGLLNAPQAEVAAAVARLVEQRDGLKQALAAFRRRAAEDMAAALAPTQGHMLLFLPEAEEGELRTVANAGMEKCGGVCAVFTGENGAWRFVMASAHTDMRAFLREHGPALRARGGGQERMVSGRSTAFRTELEAFFQ